MAAPSNGTMGHYWMAHWCFRCVHDHKFSHVNDEHADGSDGCEILLRMVSGQDTPEVVQEDYEGGWPPESLVCRMFDRCPCQDDPGWEPPTVPTPIPGQGLLFEVIDESPGLPMAVIPIETPVMTRVSCVRRARSAGTWGRFRTKTRPDSRLVGVVPGVLDGVLFRVHQMFESLFGIERPQAEFFVQIGPVRHGPTVPPEGPWLSDTPTVGGS